jgi:hypothetical protein
MSIKRHHSSVVFSLLIAGLVGLFNVGAVIAGAPSDACALLTAPEVSSALGAVVGQGQPVIPNNTTLCGWSEQGVPAGTARNVTLSLMTVKSFENGKTPMTGITKTPVSGIGDDAYFIEPPATVSGLSVRKGDVCFQIKARSNPGWFKTGKTPASQEKDRGVDRALALEVLKKLGGVTGERTAVASSSAVPQSKAAWSNPPASWSLDPHQ